MRAVLVALSVITISIFSTHPTAFAQTGAASTNIDAAAKRQKKKEQLAREKQNAAKQWPIDSKKAMSTWTATREKRLECRKTAGKYKMSFAKRVRFVKECMAAKTDR